MMSASEALPRIYLVKQSDQEFIRDLYHSLEEAGFDDIVFLTMEDLVEYFRSPEPQDRNACILVNPFGNQILDPWHEVWELRNHHLVPVLLYIDPSTPQAYQEMSSRLKQLYRVLSCPFDPQRVRREILEVVELFVQASKMYSSSPWLAAGSASVDEGILIVDIQRKIRYANPAAERLLNIPVVRLYSSEIDEVVLLENIQRSQQPVIGMSLVERADLRLNDGSRIPVEVQQNAIHDLRKERIGTVILIRDERSAVQFAATMREANQQEELHARARSEFIANMSHELRTPLNSILGMADLAAELAENPDQQEFLSLLKSSTRNLSNLVTTILDYAKLEARNLTLEYERFQLIALVEQSLRPLILRAQGKNLRVYLDLQPGMRSIYRGDKGRIAQILENLFQNAVKFTRSGFIRCRIYEREAPDATTLTEIRQPVELMIEIEDSGIGIEETQIGQIFDPFFQVDATATRGYGGTGLGLSIARRLAVRMGGDVDVRSEPGEGSVFTARIVVNREESDLLLLNKKLIGASVVSDQIPAYLAEQLGGLHFAFVSHDPHWAEPVTSWLDFIGLPWKAYGSPGEVTRLRPEELDSVLFFHDYAAPWHQQLADFFILTAGRSSISCNHIISIPGTIEPDIGSWSDVRLSVEYLIEPITIDALLRSALRWTSVSDNRQPPQGALRLRSVYLIAAAPATGAGAGGGDTLEDLQQAAARRGIELRKFHRIDSLGNTELPSADIIICIDGSAASLGLLSDDEALENFSSSVHSLHGNSGHQSPVAVLLDGAAASDYIAEREERLRSMGFSPIRLFDWSAAAMLSAMERFAAEAMTRATNINKPVHQEMLEQIHQRATAGDYASLQKLTNTYRDHYKKQDRLQLANDLFRINLAARREDSETIFDILNNIRKDIDKMSNL
jgi:signal transduction histidine kinase